VPGYSLKVLPEVRDQIRDALRRTRDEYGPEKAREYSQLIRLALRDMAENPYIRQLRPEIHPDARLMHIRRPGQNAAHRTRPTCPAVDVGRGAVQGAGPRGRHRSGSRASS
jgi:plasmid stabilization system protein ParE